MKPVKVAIIDSGIHRDHPHIGAVAGGVRISGDGETDDFVDTLGHGTAVAAAIHEKATQADLYAVKVFDRKLATKADILIRAIEWCVANEMDIVNVSLGATNEAHRPKFERAVAALAAAGVTLVAAREAEGAPSFPGCLEGVLAVGVYPDCPRDRYQCRSVDGQTIFLASPYPRPIPGVPPEKNLHGVSFAVANMTGFAAEIYRREGIRSTPDLAEALTVSERAIR